ncbi:MAG: hypothetical protein H0X30_01010 [Anaerolineae bacterium]|nr:hypothetical protein [Anaerolineae bacterium]
MKIEALDVSEECRDKLRSGGVDTVDDIVDFFSMSLETRLLAFHGEKNVLMR